VIEQRMQFQELMRERFEEVVEKATGRHVIGFMSGNQQEPDMMCEVLFSIRPTWWIRRPGPQTPPRVGILSESSTVICVSSRKCPMV
jgi:hypothetical protein